MEGWREKALYLFLYAKRKVFLFIVFGMTRSGKEPRFPLSGWTLSTKPPPAVFGLPHVFVKNVLEYVLCKNI